jgi:hypothetical protein
MDVKELQEDFKDIPESNTSPIVMEEPNQPIKIYSGDFVIKNEKREYHLNGEIVFKWFPDALVTFKAAFKEKNSISIQLMEIFDILIDGNVSVRLS